ncbi:MAG TPA: zinc ribbon domain-containing protein [Mycobacterium sp.]|nr:zinc ribbon domain-containing protein [Mycobacterium sp.]
MNEYALAPEEQVLHVSVASTLFPHLPLRSRNVFRTGLAVLVLLVILLALLRWQAPMIAACALGIPLLFLLYLYEANLHRDVALTKLVATALLGMGLGFGWALTTGSLVAGFYDVSLADAESRRLAVVVGIAVPVGGALLMLVPAVVMRFVRRDGRTLDGFVIGALGAIGFTATATLTRLAPQFATGVTATDRTAHALLVQAAVQGFAVPLTAAAVGGLVGAALWLGRPTVVAASVGTAVFLYAALGAMEVAPLLEGLHLGAHLMIAVLALLALRVGLQHILLRADGGGASGIGAAGRTTHSGLLSRLGAAVAVVLAAGVTVSALATPERPRYTCPPDCGRPPIGVPIDINPRFVSEDGEFSVQYPSPGSLYKVTLYSDWVSLEYLGGDTGTLDLWGELAEKRTAKEVIETMIAEYYPGATLAYEIPNAMVGYEPGYGGVYDDYPQDSSGVFTRLRLVALAAVKDGYALVATAVGPYHEFTPEFGTGHPSGVNLALALDMGKYVNSFRWRPSTSS